MELQLHELTFIVVNWKGLLEVVSQGISLHQPACKQTADCPFMVKDV